jgi:predicted secreted hydrolase
MLRRLLVPVLLALGTAISDVGAIAGPAAAPPPKILGATSTRHGGRACGLWVGPLRGVTRSDLPTSACGDVGAIAGPAGAPAGSPQAGAGGWRQADPARRLQLPRDHASHPDYKVEWWYYAGNLATAEGRRFGCQLTFFRVGVDPAPQNPSRWAVRDLFMAHLAVTDAGGRRYLFADRMDRGAAGLAGAATDSYRVWNGDWSADLRGDTHTLRAMGRAEDGTRFGIELDAREGKPFVAHGEGGYSRKGAQPGNASHYYSLTRMPTRGVLTMGGATFAVEGLSWMDHEFGTSFLEPGQAGWDWFSVQLEDGTDLMLFQMRRADGAPDGHSSGTLVLPSGAVVPLGAGAFTLEPKEHWTSPATGARYPVAWSIAVPGQRLSLAVRGVLPDQELRSDRSTGVTYWEGAIDVSGSRDGRPTRGRGYLEMTGYAGGPMSERFK